MTSDSDKSETSYRFYRYRYSIVYKPTARVPLTAAQKAACFATLAQTITTTKAETAARAAASARASAASAAWGLWCARDRVHATE